MNMKWTIFMNFPTCGFAYIHPDNSLTRASPYLPAPYGAAQITRSLCQVVLFGKTENRTETRFFRQNRKPNRLCINDGFIFGFLKKAQASQDELLVRYLLRLSIKNKFVRSEASL